MSGQSFQWGVFSHAAARGRVHAVARGARRGKPENGELMADGRMGVADF